MDRLIASSVQLYHVGGNRALKALEGLSREELHRRVAADSNPMIWIIGHMTHSRCGLLNLLGAKREMPWPEFFAKGVAAEDSSRYPELEEVLGVWNEVGEALDQRFETLTDDELSAKAPRDFPVPDKTVRGAINFMAFHEGYHVGQMAYLRKWLGKGSLVG